MTTVTLLIKHARGTATVAAAEENVVDAFGVSARSIGNRNTQAMSSSQEFW